MVYNMSMFFGLRVISIIAIIGLLFKSPHIDQLYVIAALLYFILFISILSYPFNFTWNWGEKATRNILFGNIIIIIFSIFIYSTIYYKYWIFIINWEESSITYFQSLFLSLSLWSNLWYSFIIPKNEIALLTAIEAINGYFYFAFIVAVLGIRFNEAIIKNRNYLNELSELKLFKNKYWKLVLTKKKDDINFSPYISLLKNVWISNKWLTSWHQQWYVLKIVFSSKESILLTDRKVNEICKNIQLKQLDTEEDVRNYLNIIINTIWEYYFDHTNFQTNTPFKWKWNPKLTQISK
jgi:hypothetical protein